MASEPISLNDLPVEIQLKILSYFGPEDLCLNIAKVCEEWNVMAKDMVLWKTLSYSCDWSSDINRIAEVLTNASALHSLIIHDREDAAHILQFLFPICGYLRKLILKDCWLGEESTDHLVYIVPFYPDLEVLSLEDCSPIQCAVYYLISRLRKLSVLCISNYEGGGKSVRRIAESCQHLKKLRLHGVSHQPSPALL